MRRIVVVEPGRPAYIAKIDDSLEAMQNIVGGLIEVATIFEDDVALICNEEGKIINLPPNRVLEDEDGNVLDIIQGTFFLIYAPQDNDNFETLPANLLRKYERKYKIPHVISFRRREA